MAEEPKTAQCLNEMALKVLMVEPGDLSMVGELLEQAEYLASAGEMPELTPLARAFHTALEQLVMGELADSAENFDRLAQCIVQMQEIWRNPEEAGEQSCRLFCEHLTAIGYEIAPEELGTAAAKKKAPPAGNNDSPVDDRETGEEEREPDAALPDFMQDQELLSGFVAESFEHLEAIEANILALEKNPEDPETINNLFRTFHTIKGVSGFLNLETINTLAHTTENLLDDVRNGELRMGPEVIEVVLEVGDFMHSMVQNVKEVLDHGPERYREYDIAEYVERIVAIQEGTAAPAETDRCRQGGEAAVEAAEAELEEEAENSSMDAASLGDSLEQAASARASRIGQAIKVNVEKLDSLVDAVGELVIMQSLVRQNPLVTGIADPKLSRDFSQLSRITTEIQRTAMSMRMVPIRQTFQKMVRLVRDLSKKSGKSVDLVMSGEETEIDRNMVDSIYDPLVHMIRNSVDHGVQTPAEREKAGKPPTGTVHLRAYQKGGNIVIEIEDDGQGLNAARIRRKAIERGLTGPDDALTDHQINNLIFLPGFTTAETITDVSGRGVGMDVVKKAVEKLRGKVEVQSQPGKGALFVIRLPLTLAIIDGIIVRVGTERYIIPTTAIQESLRPAESHYTTVHGRGETVTIRDKLIPIIRLYQVFGVEADCTDPLRAIMVVVENEGRQRALMVDELLGKQEVVIKSLGTYLHDIPGVAGGTILGDGRVGLILDMAGLIGGEKGEQRSAALGQDTSAVNEEVVQ